jgi:anti-sigma regulatory factor (Ser/Thr protein kinase)
MTSLSGNIINRVRRLPKPTNAAEALQPLFEAVSNGMHAVEDANSLETAAVGRINITIENARSPSDLTITVSDTGVGLDAERFEAFRTTDTDFKIKRGGKGIGRLLWLDAFDHVKIASIFRQSGKLYKRTFDLRA